MTEKPTHTIATINEVRTLPSKGPWPTKSNGQLSVLFGISFTDLSERYFHYEKSELDKIPDDVRGLRSYNVSGLQKKSIGANEWHRLRNELVIVIKGSVKWTCEDVHGDKAESILDRTSGIWVPPFILHTYEVQQDDTELLVVANTLFIPEDPSTHDTFSFKDFQKFQKNYLVT